MKLIIILICLGAVKYLEMGKFIHRIRWFAAYKKLMSPVVDKLGVIWFRVFALLLPPIVALVLVMGIFGNIVYNALGFIISLVIFAFCIGDKDLRTEYHSYLCESDSKPEGTQNNKTIAETIIWQSNERQFAVIFWFVILGPVGALLYRLTALIRDDEGLGANVEANQIQAILDWPVVRFVGLLYALAGNFVTGFAHWTKEVLTNINTNKQFLFNAAFTAMNKKGSDSFSLKDNRELLTLQERTLILMLVAIAFTTLGAWIY